MMRAAMMLVAATLAPGCKESATDEADKARRIESHLRRLTAGEIGCLPGDISLLDWSYRERGDSWWLAECGNRQYVCSLYAASKHQGGMVHNTSCRPRQH